jgi:hypothetical protein
LLAVALAVASFIVTGDDEVDSDDTVAQIVAFWRANDSDQVVGAILSVLALVPLVWFLGSLRSALRKAEGETGRLSAIAFGGGLILVALAAVDSSLQFAVAETADDVPPYVTHTLSVLYSDFFIGFPVGLATLTLASALAILRTGALPAWTGWFALVIGIVSLTPLGFFGFLAILVWILIVSVILFRQESPPAAPAAPAAPTVSA